MFNVKTATIKRSIFTVMYLSFIFYVTVWIIDAQQGD